MKLVKTIEVLGYPCIHVNTILDKWYTKDSEIAKYVDENDYILITKDSDFRDSFFIKNTPKKLIKINLGNISNKELIFIFENNLSKIESISINNSNFIIEVNLDDLTFLKK